jgi:hypothetical protein
MGAAKEYLRLPHVAVHRHHVLTGLRPYCPCLPMLGSEHPLFYEHECRAMRRTHSKTQENQPPTYPRYATGAYGNRNCFT